MKNFKLNLSQLIFFNKKVSLSIKSLFLILFLSYFALGINAQQKFNGVNVVFGDKVETDKGVEDYDIIGSDDSGTYVEKVLTLTFGFTTFLEHYDNALNKTKSVVLELGKNTYPTDYILSNGKLIFLSSNVDKKLKQKILVAQTIEKNTLKINEDGKKIATVNYTGKDYFKIRFQKVVSPDSSKILIYYNTPNKKEDKTHMTFKMYDEQLNELWQKEITLPYKSELLETQKYLVDNTGNVHILTRLVEKVKKVNNEFSNDVNFDYKILSYLDNGATYKEHTIELDGKFLYNMVISLDNNQNVVCASVYSTILDSYKEKNGWCFFKIDKNTKEISVKKHVEFAEDIATRYISSKKNSDKKKEGKGVVYDFKVHDIISLSDGNLLLNIEQFYTSSHVTSYDVSTSNYYHDVIAINLNSEGETNWIKKIQKRQYSQNPDIVSIFVSEIKGKTYYIFNDNKENLSSNNGEPFPYNESFDDNQVVTILELEKDGTQKRKVLFNNGDIHHRTSFSSSIQISKNEVFLYGKSKKGNQFINLSFK